MMLLAKSSIMMDSNALVELFGETTTLKPGQKKVLSKIILKYDETDDLAYEVIGLINNGTSYKQLKEDFINEKFEWDSSVYKTNRDLRAFRDAMLTKPPEVREGEMECPKCHKKKTMVREMQTRSADEGFTYYIHCFNPACKKITKT